MRTCSGGPLVIGIFPQNRVPHLGSHTNENMVPNPENFGTQKPLLTRSTCAIYARARCRVVSMEHEDCPARTSPDDHYFFRMVMPEGGYFKSDYVFYCSGCGEELLDADED